MHRVDNSLMQKGYFNIFREKLDEILKLVVIPGLRQSLRTRLPTTAPRHPMTPTHPLLTHTDLALNTSQEAQNAPQPIKLLSLHPTQTENNMLLMVSYVLLLHLWGHVPMQTGLGYL